MLSHASSRCRHLPSDRRCDAMHRLGAGGARTPVPPRRSPTRSSSAPRRARARPGPSLRGSSRAARSATRPSRPATAQLDRLRPGSRRRPSGVARVVASGVPLIVADARASRESARTSSSASTSLLIACVPLSLGRRGPLRRDPDQPEAAWFDPEALMLAETAGQPGGRRARAASSPSSAAPRAPSATPRLPAPPSPSAPSPELVEVLETLAREADLADGLRSPGVYLARRLGRRRRHRGPQQPRGPDRDRALPRRGRRRAAC